MPNVVIVGAGPSADLLSVEARRHCRVDNRPLADQPVLAETGSG